MRTTLLVALTVGLSLTLVALANLNWLAENSPIFGMLLVPGVLVEPFLGGPDTRLGWIAFYIVQAAYYVVFAIVLRAISKKVFNYKRG